MRKVAVIFRGQMRTWKYLSSRNIQIIRERLNREIDWYFCYPETTTVTEDEIRAEFLPSETVKVKIVKDSDYKLFRSPNEGAEWKKYPDAYFRQAFFEYFAGIDKRQHELQTGIRYKNTICLRPDCMLFESNLDLLPLSNELCGFMISDETKGDLVGADFHYVAGDKASNLMHMRFLDTAYTDGLLQAIHGGDLEYPQYYLRANLISQPTQSRRFFSYRHIRPIHVPFFNDIEAFREKLQDYLDLLEVWNFMPKDEMIRLCNDYKIDIRDYSISP